MSDDGQRSAGVPAEQVPTVIEEVAEGDGEEGEALAGGEGEPTLLELVLAEQAERAEPPARPARVDGVVVGRLVAVEAGQPLVELDWSPGERFAARTMTALGPSEVGRDVALLFEGGDPARPVVMGLMHALPDRAPTGLTREGRRLVLSGDQEIVLRCGKASITLTRAGKIILRGTYLLTRSSGVNRIQGGSVQIN
jgi:hypothetical protein